MKNMVLLIDTNITKCAKTAQADYIITRNISDFAQSEIPVILPQNAIHLTNGVTGES